MLGSIKLITCQKRRKVVWSSNDSLIQPTEVVKVKLDFSIQQIKSNKITQSLGSYSKEVAHLKRPNKNSKMNINMEGFLHTHTVAKKTIQIF